MEFGWKYLPRKKHIQNLMKDKQQPTYPIRFGGELRNLPQWPVPIGFARYRIENGRTRAAQREYLAKNPKVPKDFFTGDKERDAVQKVQHALLKEMVHEQGLIEHFKRIPEQDKPLVLTHDGFVLNGNRRLCAWRELLEKDARRYRNFKTVRVVFLPQCTDEQLVELEAALQIQKDIKADYAWTARSVLARDLRNTPYSDKKIAEMFGAKETEIQRMIEMLELAEEYLDSRKKAFQYGEVRQAEFAFKRLLEAQKKLRREPAKLDLFKQAAYHIIEGDRTGAGRKYGQIPDALKHFDKVAAALMREYGIGPDKPIKKKHRVSLLGDSKQNPLGSLVKTLQSRGNGNKIRDIIIDTVQSAEMRERKQKTKSYVLDKVTDANRFLQEAIAAFSDQVERDGIKEQLKSVVEAAKKLQKLLR